GARSSRSMRSPTPHASAGSQRVCSPTSSRTASPSPEASVTRSSTSTGLFQHDFRGRVEFSMLSRLSHNDEPDSGYGLSGPPRHPGAGGGGWEPSARMRAIRSQLRTRSSCPTSQGQGAPQGDVQQGTQQWTSHRLDHRAGEGRPNPAHKGTAPPGTPDLIP